jgi:hypothetical protein
MFLFVRAVATEIERNQSELLPVVSNAENVAQKLLEQSRGNK